MSHAGPLLVMLIVEAGFGYPRRWWHPVMAVGALIDALDARWNRGDAAIRDGARRSGLLRDARNDGIRSTFNPRKLAGVGVLAVLIGASVGAGWAITWLAGAGWGVALVVLVGTTGLAQRSLNDHVAAALVPLRAGDLAGARNAVARIVGRDTGALDAGGIATAATESLAESFCDGVVAPAFWFLLLGLPGLFAAKAINTADSMIGHRTVRHAAFGWASARADDVVNWIPARIAGGAICLAGGGGWRTMWRDAGRHASPNAGWPEAAMAGALGVRLGGPVAYGGALAERAWLGDGHTAQAMDVGRALAIYRGACLLLWLGVGGLAWLG